VAYLAQLVSFSAQHLEPSRMSQTTPHALADAFTSHFADDSWFETKSDIYAENSTDLEKYPFEPNTAV
jgi:hypothetical protein